MVELRGMLHVAQAGVYRFMLGSDDGSLLWLDDELITSLDHDSDHPLEAAASTDLQLGTGLHPIRVSWYNAGAGGALFLRWQTPGRPGFEHVPVAAFSPLG
jgi:hypothetical protein